MWILAIVIPVIVVLAGVLVFASSRRRDLDDAQGRLSRETVQSDRGAPSAPAQVDSGPSGKEVERAAVLARREPSKELVPAGTAAPAPFVPPDTDAIGVARRQFLNRGIIALMGFSLSAFGLTMIGFLWPPFVTGFGAKINLGKIDDLKTKIGENNGFFYVPEGRMWVTEYPAAALAKARDAYTPGELAGMEAGIVTLFQKCPHLGCRVPQCLTSQWFECPCHGSRYNRVGEKRGGPAPRGMDRFTTSVNDKNELIADTGAVIQGPPIGTNTTNQEAEGPSCLGASTHE